MKITINTLFLLIFATATIGCGSDSSSSSTASNSNGSSPITPNEPLSEEDVNPIVIAPSITTNSYELIIDNGRGTVNNQNTERSDTANVSSN